MYIKKIHIENYRNFKTIDVPLKKYTTIVGENDIGKSNLLDALKLILNNNSIQFYAKRLILTDINLESINDFRKKIIENIDDLKLKLEKDENIDEYIEKIPIVKISISFTDATDDYQKKLLSDWINIDEESTCYTVEYCFKPKDNTKFLKTMAVLMQLDSNASLPIELYDYNIYSTNNDKGINMLKYKNFNTSIINAERDNFSENSNKVSYKLVSSLLEKKLDDNDKGTISKAYNTFFNSIKNLESYKTVFENIEKNDLINVKKIVDEIELIPNSPNLNTIFSNINIGYGNEFLYQKGLGKRNLVLILLLFSNYNIKDKQFNLICVEEPEAHLCVNNLNIALDFIEKSISTDNSFCQTIITSHNPKTINKLKFENVVILSNNKCITFDEDVLLSNYLAKRQNFDILKILFADNVILVEGPTEEMFINTLLSCDTKKINNIEVISIGHKGFRTFLDIWKKVNDGSSRKIGIVRDYDNQDNAKNEHDKYNNDKTIFVRTTKGYTFEDDLISAGENRKTLSEFFSDEEPCNYMKNNKAEAMLDLCNKMLEKDSPLCLAVPTHIEEIINGLQK